jgi:hypothetical protein
MEKICHKILIVATRMQSQTTSNTGLWTNTAGTSPPFQGLDVYEDFSFTDKTSFI